MNAHLYVYLALAQLGFAVGSLLRADFNLDVISGVMIVLSLCSLVFVLCPWLVWQWTCRKSDGVLAPGMTVIVKSRKKWSDTGEEPAQRATILYRPLLTNVPPFIVIGADDRWWVRFEDGSRKIIYHTLLEPEDAITQLGNLAS